jgi:GTP-binding protein Era
MKLHSGYVTITGKPNVGKSTLVNTIFKHKVAIVSYKPQTTRNQIKALYSDNDSSIMFIDTPGYHETRNKLDLFLNSEIKTSYKSADLAILLIDLTREIDAEDLEVIKMLKDFNITNVILVLTKIDAAKKDNPEKYKNKIVELIDVKDTVTISSSKGENIDVLLKTIKKYLPLQSPINEKLDENDDFIISEIVREQIIYNTKQEVPYASGVFVEAKKFEKGLLDIHASIVVEKESQKPIIIGKGGTMIKKIGTLARKELLDIYDCKINLKLFVKVEKE